MHGNLASCSAIRRNVSAFVDGRLPERDWQEVRHHLEDCTDCSRQTQQLLQVRASMQALPRRTAPAQLSARLRVLASREHARHTRRATLRSTLKHLCERIDLTFQNLMRPLALPAAGGLASTVVLFCAMLPSFTPNRTPGIADTPINEALFTGARVRCVLPVGFSQDNVSVNVRIDENGSMVDYTFADGQRIHDPQLLRNLENTLLFTRYFPATAFGQPTSGQVRVTFRRTAVDVKG